MRQSKTPATTALLARLRATYADTSVEDMAAMTAHARRLERALRELEWSMPWNARGPGEFCPYCKCPKSGGVHDRYCDLGRALNPQNQENS